MLAYSFEVRVQGDTLSSHHLRVLAAAKESHLRGVTVLQRGLAGAPRRDQRLTLPLRLCALLNFFDAAQVLDCMTEGTAVGARPLVGSRRLERVRARAVEVYTAVLGLVVQLSLVVQLCARALCTHVAGWRHGHWRARPPEAAAIMPA